MKKKIKERKNKVKKKKGKESVTSRPFSTESEDVWQPGPGERKFRKKEGIRKKKKR